jgi:hypothetical protein
MESTLLELAVSQGIWVLVSVFLMLHIIKKQDFRDQIQAERENKYQAIIEHLIDKLLIIEDIKNDIEK